MKKAFFFAMMIQFGFLLYAGIDFLMTSTVPLLITILISIMLFIDSMLYVIFLFIPKKHGFFMILFNLFIILNIALTLTDEVGVVDYIVLIINVFIIVIYHIERYLTKTS